MTAGEQPLVMLSPAPGLAHTTITNHVQQTTPKLPKRERLASFSRLIASESFVEFMPDKLKNRQFSNRRSQKKLNVDSENFPDIKISPASPTCKIPTITKLLDENSNRKSAGYSGLLPFSPKLTFNSPQYASPGYEGSMPMNSPLYLSDRKGVFLGRGSFGNVTLCTYKGKKFALKVTQEGLSCIGEHNFVNIRHPHLISILHVAHILDKVFICMEFAGHCNLQQVLDTKSELDFPRRLSFCIQIASGLRHCHQRRIVHGDVKPANVIVSPYGKCKLGDFGHSINLDSINKSEVVLQHDIVGTAAYAAPEVLRGALPNLPSDIYSFGILLWQVQTRELPFAGEHPHVIIYKVANYGARPEFETCITGGPCDPYEETVKRCWHENPAKRLNATEVLRNLQNIEQNIKTSVMLN